jgi:hypothetical protein
MIIIVTKRKMLLEALSAGTATCLPPMEDKHSYVNIEKGILSVLPPVLTSSPFSQY